MREKGEIARPRLWWGAAPGSILTDNSGWGSEGFVMFGMWFLRVRTMTQWLCCYSGGETKAKEGTTADSGVVFRTVGCEILADV